MYVAADGTSLYMQSESEQQTYVARYGANAYAQWAIDRNLSLLESGTAIDTPDGIQLLTNVVAVLQQHGYTGPLDANSIAQAYKMLRTPPPAPAAAVGASARVSGLPNIPQPLLFAAGAVLLLMLLRGRR